MAENFTNLSNVVVQGFVKSSGQGTLLGSFETMPTASAQNAGQIVLYTGTTAGSYTKGRYYKSDGTSWTEYDAGQVTASTLEGYVPKDGSKVLSDNNYTTSEKNKLAGIATGAQVNKIDVVKVNGTALTPDASKAVNVTIDLSSYATKAEVSAIPKFAVQVVASLPTSSISTSTIYLVSHGGSAPEIYDEYIYVNSAWEKIGTTETDLSNYVTNDALTSKLNGYQPTISAGTGITKSGNTVSLATSGVTAGSKGSATAVPIVTVDEYGRVTALGTATIYPPTTAGTSGQIWTSDGSGAGAWVSPATTATSGSTTPITSGAVYSKLAEKQDKLSSAGSSTTPVYVNSSGVPTACSYSLGAAASKGVDTSVNSGSSNLVTGGAVYSAINTVDSKVTTLQGTVSGKQDKLTFDSTPTEGSSNPVTSGGVFSAINSSGGGKQLYTGSLESLVSWSNYTMTIAKEFDIEYIHRKSGNTYITRVTVSKGSYMLDPESMNSALGIAYAYISLASLSFWIYTLGNAPYVQALSNSGSGYVATQVTSEEIPSNVSQYAYRLFL